MMACGIVSVGTSSLDHGCAFGERGPRCLVVSAHVSAHCLRMALIAREGSPRCVWMSSSAYFQRARSRARLGSTQLDNVNPLRLSGQTTASLPSNREIATALPADLVSQLRAHIKSAYQFGFAEFGNSTGNEFKRPLVLYLWTGV